MVKTLPGTGLPASVLTIKYTSYLRDGRILHYYILSAHIYRGEIVEGSV